ncbi:MAG: hypothetical protein AAF697_07660 [Pseudomonadota bacterium]
MAHSDLSPDPNSSVTVIPTRTPRPDGWTPAKQVGFLRTLATTQSVSAAAQSVGMGRQSAYKLRARLDDAPFGAAWRAAIRGGHEALLEAALDRALHGVEVPHYWQGELVGTSRRYDERLTAMLLTSGLLQSASRPRPFAEGEFSGRDFSRLLDRVAHGPAQWSDNEAEARIAWGESLARDEFAPDNSEQENPKKNGE